MSLQNSSGSVLPVRLYGDKCLRKVSPELPRIDSDTLSFIADLIETMYAKDGVGLAAPQVGKNIRIFIVDPQWFETNTRNPLVFINPKFTSLDGVEVAEEGCLSLPDITAEVSRAKKITIDAINEKGELVRHQAEGLFSRAIQHEFDHLEGVLFVDRVSKLKQLMLKAKLKKIESLTDENGVNTDETMKDETATR